MKIFLPASRVIFLPILTRKKWLFLKNEEKKKWLFFFDVTIGEKKWMFFTNRRKKMNVFHQQKKMTVFNQQKKKNDCFQPTEEKKWLFSTDRRKKMTVFKNSHFFYSLGNDGFSTFWAVYFFSKFFWRVGRPNWFRSVHDIFC